MANRKGSAENSAIPHTRIEDESWIEKHYEIGEKIGQGMFGKVFKVKHIETDVYWAMKVINKEKAGTSAVKLLEREVAILKMVDHDNIIKLNEVFETGKKMFLIMELCEGGELADVLKEKQTFSEEDTKVIVTKLADAISYLHKKDIVHRDLKLENILLSQNPNDPKDHLHIKVTDFGLSVVKGGVGHDNMMQDFCGTPIYMSPEIIDNKAYSQQCDVWAMGVIAYWLICGSPPFKSNSEEELYDLIKKGVIDFTSELWGNVSEAAKKCITVMLKTDPAHRVTASEVCHHHWLTGIERESQNVLDLMKQFRQEEEDKKLKSAINGPVENGEENGCNSEENSTEQPKETTRKGSAESKKPGSGGKSGNSNRLSTNTDNKSKNLTSTSQQRPAKSPAPPKINHSKTNNTRQTHVPSSGKPKTGTKKT